MVDLQYGTFSYDRQRGNFPVFPVINMFVEEVPVEQSPVLMSRPGLGFAPSPNMGFTNPIATHGMFYIDGVLSNQWFAVDTSPTLWKGNPGSGGMTSVGSIDGTGPVSWGAYSSELFVNAGNSLWKYDGTTLSTVATPGGFSVTAICEGASRLIIIDAGTGKFYWSDPLGLTIPTLNFATAENSPDRLLDCVYVGDALYLFGPESVEIWPANTDPNLPFQPLKGRTMNTGIRATGCVQPFDKSFAWITQHNNVCIGDANNIVSHPGIEEKLSLSVAASLWTFWLEGTEFIALRLDNNTFVYSAKTKQWSEFKTGGQTNWYPASYANGYFGTGIGGGSSIFQWLNESNSSGAYTDVGDGTFERRFRCGAPLTDGNLRVDNLTLRVNEGYTPSSGGGRPAEFAHPTIKLSTSRDGGNSFTALPTRSLGINGSYRIPPQWRSLGTYGFPGFIAEVSVTDRVPFRISGVKLNEGYATR